MKNLLLILFSIVMLGLTGTTGAAGKGKSGKKASPVPVSVYTIDGCSACTNLTSTLRQQGVKLKVSSIEPSKYSAFPTVVYSDGLRDHGDRIYAGACSLPGSLKVLNTQNSQ